VTGSGNLQDEYVRHQPGLTEAGKENVMARKSATARPAPDVPYSDSVPSVAGFTRKLFKRPPKAVKKQKVSLDELPDLTDAWFAEVIQQIDEATARLRR
jgi:hypothetical protein